jgi:hypothetical protein
MNYWILLASVLIGCLVCLPLFKYLFKAVVQNAPEFDEGYSKVKHRDATEDFITAHGSRDTTVNSFAFYNLIVLLLPLIPACFVAVPVYFIIEWLFRYAT